MDTPSVAAKADDQPTELTRLPTAPTLHDIDREAVAVFVSAYKNYENKVAAYEQSLRKRLGTYTRTTMRSCLASKPLQAMMIFLGRPYGTPTGVQDSQVSEFLTKLVATTHISLKKVKEGLSRELKWDKREQPLTRAIRLIQTIRDDEERHPLQDFWNESEANVNARADLLLTAIGRTQPRLASRLREELKTTKRGKEIKHNLKDFYDLILLRVEQCAQWEDEEPSEDKPVRSLKRDSHFRDDESDDEEPPKRPKVGRLTSGATGAGVRFRAPRPEHGRDRESRDRESRPIFKLKCFVCQGEHRVKDCPRASPEEKKRAKEEYHAHKRMSSVRPPHGHGMLEIDGNAYPYLLDSGCSDTCIQLNAVVRRKGNYQEIDPLAFDLADPKQCVTAVGIIELDVALTTAVGKN